jgi:CDP-glycerol:poly(glycerophosphate) glycerophosphotransferase
MPDPVKLFYTYSQIYQLSYALPIYRAAGGTFLVKNLRKWIQFKKYMRNLGRPVDPANFLSTPPVKQVHPKKYENLTGVHITPSVEKFYPPNDRIINIFTGHGSGDKPYLGENIYEKMATFDFHFLAGPKNLKKLQDKTVDIHPDKLIKIGNMRFDDYLNNRIDRRLEYDRLRIKNRELKNILYAPTWQWGKGSLLTWAHRFSEELGARYNLIIRPHGHDRMKISKLQHDFKKKQLENIYFSNPSNLARHDTMNDFAVSDLLISDRTSSIVYEYLVTGKPVIVIDNDFEETHDMPAEMLIDDIASHWDKKSNITKLIEHTFAAHVSRQADYTTLLNTCFYFNDGRSTQRAIEFIQRVMNEMG